MPVFLWSHGGRILWIVDDDSMWVSVSYLLITVYSIEQLKSRQQQMKTILCAFYACVSISLTMLTFTLKFVSVCSSRMYHRNNRGTSQTWPPPSTVGLTNAQRQEVYDRLGVGAGPSVRSHTHRALYLTANHLLEAERRDYLENALLVYKSDAPVPACAICLEEITADAKLTRSYNGHCTHVFHHACIVDWLLHDPTCPCCRQQYLEFWEPSNVDSTSDIEQAEESISIPEQVGVDEGDEQERFAVGAANATSVNENHEQRPAPSGDGLDDLYLRDIDNQSVDDRLHRIHQQHSSNT
jgi:hypothetical protein